MDDFKIRTENIKPNEILDYFVGTSEDRQTVDRLKSETPVVLVGSRGVGKSFLLRVAEAEQKREFESTRVVPVYVSFTQGSVLQLTDEAQFYHWMLARLCSTIVRSFKKLSIIVPEALFARVGLDAEVEYLNELIKEFENSWKNKPANIDLDQIPSVDKFKEFLEDICEEAEIERINIYIDEAAHILRPAQQRQFFGLYRDVNSPYVNCNAAVYPGVTSFGKYFQPMHDAVFINLERDPRSSNYVGVMREIVEKQADSRLMGNILRNGQNFAVLANSANGNPRLLLKTLGRAQNLTSKEINNVVKTFYKNDIWEEHSLLADKYMGFIKFIDWGRNFIEDVLLPELKEKNDSYLKGDKKTTCFFWIHRGAPERIKKALSLLCYTGIITLHSEAMKATRSQLGSRYSVNMGCLLALENRPATDGFSLIKNVTIKRMTEYGANHSSFDSLDAELEDFDESAINDALQRQLDKSVEYLDLPRWLIERLIELSLTKIRDVLEASEETIQKAYYVGEVRSRYIKNEATSAVFEYLSG